MDTGVTCQHCNNQMHKTTKGEHDIGMQLLGVALFIIGVCLLFVVPIGTVVGIVLMLAAARMGYKKRKVWKCGGCGYIYERA